MRGGLLIAALVLAASAQPASSPIVQGKDGGDRPKRDPSRLTPKAARRGDGIRPRSPGTRQKKRRKSRRRGGK